MTGEPGIGFKPTLSKQRLAQLARRLGADAGADGKWVLAAMDPADRRALFRRLDTWVSWLVGTYRLRSRIPPCWYRHPDAVERLKNLYVAWTHINAQPDTDRPFALVDFDDALDRQLARTDFPLTCLESAHDDWQDHIRSWATDDDFPEWLQTDEMSIAPPTHPEGSTVTTDPTEPESRVAAMGGMIMSTEEMTSLIESGAAQRLAETPAVRYENTWWLGDTKIYVRILDKTMLADLDEKARKLAAADDAIARARGGEAAPRITGEDEVPS